ncbi:hypothetical protein [Draconibacterium orientale]|uniref:hypothetical protein n=1 Tax=Draconibacterium orientale TaxID=1168034 RepID=UPI0029C0F522|nr:hypothetical protein [Draconibacterium orientale]
MNEWRIFVREMPGKILFHFYELKFIEEGQGEKVWISKIFWDGIGWSLYNPQNIEGGEALVADFWKNKNQIYWREFRAFNLAD